MHKDIIEIYGIIIILNSVLKYAILHTVETTKTKTKIMKTITKKVTEIIDGEKCPLPIEVIPNNMGINLCSVDSISWDEFDDGQLSQLTINFIPEVKEEIEKL